MFMLRDFKNNSARAPLSGCGVPGGVDAVPISAPHPSHAHLFLWDVFRPLLRSLTSNAGGRTPTRTFDKPVLGIGNKALGAKQPNNTATSSAQSTFSYLGIEEVTP